MRALLRLSSLAVVCLLAVLVLAVPAGSQQEEPSISLSPSEGVPGTTVTVRGYAFDAEKEFVIYYYDSSGSRTKVASGETDEDGDFRVSFVVPESCKGAHEVRVYIGSSLEAKDEFTVVPGLTASPEEGPVGTTVTVKGRGFAEDEEDIEVRYYFDGNYKVVADGITANAKGSWEVSFKVPASSSGSHKIDARGDESTLGEVKETSFEVVPGIAIDKSSGSAGESITVSGSGFAAGESNIRVMFDGTVVVSGIRADDNGYWESTFSLPEMPGGRYTVTAEGSKTAKKDIKGVSFEIKASLSLSPAEGHVGTIINVSGSAFAAGKNVVVRYDDIQVASTTTDEKGSFSASFPAPSSIHGSHQVTAEDAAGNRMTAVFTMESQPPAKPALTAPADGSRVGFVGKVTPTFEWSEVRDDSGVVYSLQIATSEDFAAPVVSIAGLSEPRYTLPQTEGLSQGRYYWRVKAVDGAQNDSGWTAAFSFKAGLLPLWAFITAVALLVVLIGLLVYFLVIRRRQWYY